VVHSVGIDLHRSRSHIAVIDDGGGVLLLRRIIADPELFLARWPRSTAERRGALEATYGWELLAEVLRDAGSLEHSS
jgi:hypothetical protein